MANKICERLKKEGKCTVEICSCRCKDYSKIKAIIIAKLKKKKLNKKKREM